MVYTIPPIDKKLLETLQIKLALTSPPLCADFYNDLETFGYGIDHPVTPIFEKLLLAPSEQTADLLLSVESFNLVHCIALLESYLGCLARRAPRALGNEKETRIVLEASRKIVFKIIKLIAEASQDENLEGNPLPEHIISYREFLNGCEQTIAEEQRPLCLLGMQFDFGNESILTVQEFSSEISKTLADCIREQDLLCQITARRWIIALKGVNDPNIASLAATKIRRAFAQSIRTDKRTALVTPYIGIVLSHTFEGNLNDLIDAASVAADVPVSALEGFQFYSPELDQERKRLDKLAVLLKKAIHDNELMLYFQPKYSISKQKIVGVESLLRWKLPTGYVDIPSIFTLIERENLLEAFTTWLFQTAFRNLAEFLSYGMDIKMSVNILPQNLVQPEFPIILENMLNIWKVPRERVVIEITEGSLLSDSLIVLEAIERMKEMGLTISLDDFGTGYSSLAYLSKLPIDELKIDQAFVRHMFESPKDAAIVKAIVEIGQNFGLTLVSEGIETAKDASYISSLGCDIMQGYWISKPLPQQTVIEWFQKDPKHQWIHLPPSL